MDKYKNIPEALKARNQWVCYELVYDNEKGKSSKIPKNPNNGYNAKSNDSSTWSDYSTAVNAEKRYRFDGIGFESWEMAYLALIWTTQSMKTVSLQKRPQTL